MASTHKHIRSSTANKRPTTAIADGQIALNTNSASPGLFFKDSTGATIIKIGPVHVGATAPNASPAAGGSAGNSTGEIWLDNSLTPVGVKIWNGSAWVNATPIGSTTVQGLLELATDAETQAGSDNARAVTPASLQSKVSDSTSTTSSTTIASSTAVKAAYDLANAALPKTGGTITGNLEIGTTGSLSFEGSTADAFETTIAVTDPTADRTITLPDTTGTVVTTGDTGTVTSTMIANGTIVDADINASAAIADTKLATISTAGKVNGTALTGTIPSAVLGNSSTFVGTTSIALNRSSANQALTGISSVALPGSTSGTVTVQPTAIAGTTTITLPATTGTVVTTGDSGTVTSTMIADGTIVNGDINASAAIAGTKISPDFGSQTVQTTGIFSHALGTAAAPTVTFTGDTNTGIYSPGADQVAISTNGSGRLRVSSTGTVEIVGAGTIGSTQAVSFNGSAPVNSMVLDSSGRVGIGTSSPGYALDTLAGSGSAIAARFRGNGGANNNTQIRFYGNNAATDQWAIGGSIATSDTGRDFHIYDLVANANRFAINSSGNVGIGTTAPQSPLVVSNGGANGIEFGPINGDIFTYNRSTSAYTNTQITCNEFVVRTNGSNERARIDSSGRLLVGTSSGSDNNALLKVQGNVGGTTGTGWIDIRRGLTTPGSGSQLGLLSFSDASGNNYAFIDAYVDATPGTNDYPGRLVFSTTADGASSPTERMRIGSGGGITHTANESFVHTTSLTYTGFQINKGADRTYLWWDRIRFTSGNFYVVNDSASVGVVLVNGSTAWAAVSDERLKADLKPITDGLDKVGSLRAVTGRYKTDEVGISRSFLIAQDVQAVLPEAVSVNDDDDDTLNLRYSEVIPLLVAALKESKERIETLEAKVAALEAA